MSENKKSSISTKSTCHLLNIKHPSRMGKRLKLSFRRIHAVLNVLKTEKSVDASMGLIDLSESGAGFFTQELLVKGSTVEVCITEPRLLKVKGVVAWSVPVQSGVESSRFKFRSGMQFVFENEVQRAAVIEYIRAVNMDPLENMKASASAAPLPASGLAPEASEPNVAFIEQNKPAADGVAPAAVAGDTPAEATAGNGEAPAAASVPAEPAAPVAAAAPVAEAPKAEETPAAPQAAEEPKAA